MSTILSTNSNPPPSTPGGSVSTSNTPSAEEAARRAAEAAARRAAEAAERQRQLEAQRRLHESSRSSF